MTTRKEFCKSRLGAMLAGLSAPLLLEIAYAYEQGTRHRRPPKYLVSD